MRTATARKRVSYRCSTCDADLGPNPKLGPPPHYAFPCGCHDPDKGKKKVRLPSPQEKIQAILDARKDVAEFLQSIGKMDAFADFTKDDICGLIRAATDGVQRSLHEQLRNSVLDDEIPF